MRHGTHLSGGGISKSAPELLGKHLNMLLRNNVASLQQHLQAGLPHAVQLGGIWAEPTHTSADAHPAHPTPIVTQPTELGGTSNPTS